MFSPVFGLSDRVPLESSTAAGYNGERHLLPTKTGKMEVGSETECEQAPARNGCHREGKKSQCAGRNFQGQKSCRIRTPGQ